MSEKEDQNLPIAFKKDTDALSLFDLYVESTQSITPVHQVDDISTKEEIIKADANMLHTTNCFLQLGWKSVRCIDDVIKMKTATLDFLTQRRKILGKSIGPENDTGKDYMEAL